MKITGANYLRRRSKLYWETQSLWPYLAILQKYGRITGITKAKTHTSFASYASINIYAREHDKRAVVSVTAIQASLILYKQLGKQSMKRKSGVRSVLDVVDTSSLLMVRAVVWGVWMRREIVAATVLRDTDSFMTLYPSVEQQQLPAGVCGSS